MLPNKRSHKNSEASRKEFFHQKKKKTCFRQVNPYNDPAFSPVSQKERLDRYCGCSSVVERNLAKVDVVGSSPIIRSPACGCSSVVERNLAKVDVVGSSPIIRSPTCGCSSVVERNLAKVDVVGSSPIIRSSTCGCSSVVERNLAKVDVVGSSPIIRSFWVNTKHC